MASTVRRRAADVLAVCWRGRVTPHDFTVVAAALRAQQALQPARFVITDATAMVGFDPSLRAPMIELIGWLRERGLEQMVAVTPSSLLRIAGSTIALVTRVPLVFVESLDDAERLAGSR